MSSRFVARRARLLGGATVLLALTALAACDYGPDGDPENLAIVGSDTSHEVVASMANDYNNNPDTFFQDYNNNPDIPGDDRDKLFNVRPQQGTDGTGPLTVPGDEHCGTLTYPPTPVPNGSSAGRDALRQSVLAGNGCIDIARSSSGPRAIGTGAGQDLDSFEYYAFGLDALGYASASTLAPPNLTISQFRNIYNCTFTNWSQVGGTAGAIQRLVPQTGSGTYAFFLSDLLNNVPPATGVPGCPDPIFVQENHGNPPGGALDTFAERQAAILPYSGANWVAQSRGTTPDDRNGQTIRNLDGQNITRLDDGQFELAVRDSEFPTAPVAEQNVRLNDSTPDYIGIRYVHNVISTESPSYVSAKRYVGFRNITDGSTSPLCSGRFATTIANFGFGPLDTTTNINNNNIPGTTCRAYSVATPAPEP